MHSEESLYGFKFSIHCTRSRFTHTVQQKNYKKTKKTEKLVNMGIICGLWFIFLQDFKHATTIFIQRWNHYYSKQKTSSNKMLILLLNINLRFRSLIKHAKINNREKNREKSNQRNSRNKTQHRRGVYKQTTTE